MFKEFSTNYFHKFLLRFLWFILFFNGVAAQTNATTNKSNGTEEVTDTTQADDPPNIVLFAGIAVGSFVIIGGLTLVICVATFYAKRMDNETGDPESGRRGHNSTNNYESQALGSEENAPKNQIASQAATADDKREEDEDEETSDVEDSGHYTRVEIVPGGSKSAEVKKSNASALQSSNAEVLYTKKKVKVNGSNPLYSQVVKKGSTQAAKSQSVEDLYTKVRGKKTRKGSSATSADDELYTKSNKQKGKGGSCSTTGSADDIYTKAQKGHKHGTSSTTKETSEDLYSKSQKEQKGQKGQKQEEHGHGASASATDIVDELYTKPRKKRVAKGTTKDLDEMYTKSQKKTKIKVKKVPFYINSDKVDADQKARESTPTKDAEKMYEDEKSMDNNGSKAGIVKDNELYTDCP